MALNPMPPLDGAPPTPPGIPAGAPKPNASFSAMSPSVDPSGADGSDLQLIQMALQTAAAVSKGLQLLGQLLPGMAPVSAQLDVMLKGGMKSALQQGIAPSTEPPSMPMSSFGQGIQPNPAPMGGSMAQNAGGMNG